MAEGVVIEDIGSNLEEWANEDTQKKVYAALVTMAKSMGKIAEEITGTSDGLVTEAEALFSSFSAAQKTAEAGNKDRRKEISILGGLRKSLAGVVKNIPIVGNMAAYLIESTDSFAKTLTKVGGVLVSLVTMQIISQLGSARKMYEYGVTLQDEYARGLGVAAIAADNMRMTIGELSDFAVKYAATMKMFDIVAFSREARNMSVQLGGFGVTTLEASELLADYMKTQRLLGFTEKLNDIGAAKNRKFAMEETVKWARALGTSREEIQKAASQVMRETVATAFFRNSVLAREDEGVRKHADALMKALVGLEGGEEAASAMMNLIASEVPMANKMIMDLRAQGMTAAADTMMQIAATIRSGQDATHMLEDFAGTLTLSNTDLARFKNSFDESAGTVLALSNVMGQHRDLLRTMTVEQRKERDEQAEGAANLADAWKSLKSAVSQGIASIFYGTKATKFMAKMIKDLNDIIMENKSIFQEFFKNIAMITLGITKFIIGVMQLMNVFFDAGEAISRSVGFSDGAFRKFVPQVLLGIIGLKLLWGAVKLVRGGLLAMSMAIPFITGTAAVVPTAAIVGGGALAAAGTAAAVGAISAGALLVVIVGAILAAFAAQRLYKRYVSPEIEPATTGAGKNVKAIAAISTHLGDISKGEPALASMAVSMKTIDQHASSLASIKDAIINGGNTETILTTNIETNKNLAKDNRELINTMERLLAVAVVSDQKLASISATSRAAALNQTDVV